MFRFQQIAFCFLLIVLPIPASGDDDRVYRTWQDSTGKHKIEAAFVRRVGDTVHLKRKDNGKVITISSRRLSKQDQDFLTRALSASDRTKKSPQQDKPKRRDEKKTAFQVNDKVMFTGDWNNRKYGTKGPLRCSAIVKDGKTWSAKFDGTGVYGKFSYDVSISTQEDGDQLKLQGKSTVSGHRYEWSGQVKNGVLFGKYTASNGNNGTFRLKQVASK